ncbi:hypothetical protein Nepgr_014562 [Nepenthes gracilis]|uniref:Uncharacterized protein n=1 Tax=Nepenthes gracilis TaxID=150966 RepID=A0AAD3XQF5_NEPGR|nr:hypothetical protein Nepgr_014562 [Nepenthes gracilis]
MAGLASFNKFFSLFLLLVYLGCFILTPSSSSSTTTITATSSSINNIDSNKKAPTRRKRRGLTSLYSFKPTKALSSSWSFLKHILSPKSCQGSIRTPSSPPTPASSPARPSQRSVIQTGTQIQGNNESDPASDNSGCPPEKDIFLCSPRGENFPSTDHAVSELHDGDLGKNIVDIIFRKGWLDNERTPTIHRIFKIHNNPKTLSRFEEYRESVKSKAAAQSGSDGKSKGRCAADGNERLGFHCTTSACNLQGPNDAAGPCNRASCGIRRIIQSGFSPVLDGISVLSTSSKAHMAIPDDVAGDLTFMNVKRAMLVCRVIAGQVECAETVADDAGAGGILDHDEPSVADPRAVLPCFLVVYSA